MEQKTIEDIVIAETGVSKEVIEEISGELMTLMGLKVKALDMNECDPQRTFCAIVAFMNYAFYDFLKGRHSIESQHNNFALLVYHCARQLLSRGSYGPSTACKLLDMKQEKGTFFGPLFKL